jgi:hypothetical protein
MIKRAKCPVWPWDQAGKPGLLVEAFPMAQLYHWNLPHIEYNGQRIKEAKVREKIVSGILSYLNLGDFSTVLKESADALDAVLCAFAAIAVVKRKIAIYPLVDDCAEGWIAIHK